MQHTGPVSVMKGKVTGETGKPLYYDPLEMNWLFKGLGMSACDESFIVRYITVFHHDRL
jgi:hypothetical protein